MKWHVDENLKKEKLNKSAIENSMPCSMNLIESQNDMYIKGEGKLISEMTYARSIPEKDRFLINQHYLEVEAGKDIH